MASTSSWFLFCVGVALASFVGGGNGEMDEETVQAVRRLERRIDQLQRELDRERGSKNRQVDGGEWLITTECVNSSVARFARKCLCKFLLQFSSCLAAQQL